MWRRNVHIDFIPQRIMDCILCRFLIDCIDWFPTWFSGSSFAAIQTNTTYLLLLEGEQKKVEWLKPWPLVKNPEFRSIPTGYSSNIKYSGDEYFHQVSWRLDNNCEFFINSNVLSHSTFFVHPLYFF